MFDTPQLANRLGQRSNLAHPAAFEQAPQQRP